MSKSNAMVDHAEPCIDQRHKPEGSSESGWTVCGNSRFSILLAFIVDVWWDARTQAHRERAGMAPTSNREVRA